MAAAFAALQKAKEQREKDEERMREADLLMRKAFKKTDKDGSGQLDIDEMLDALKAIGEYDVKKPSKAAKVRNKVVKAAGEDAEFSFEEYKAFIDTIRLEKNKWNVVEPWVPHSAIVKAFYDLSSVQLVVAFIILFNFLCMVLMAETDPYTPENQHHKDTWMAIDFVCNVIFLFELLINLYGNFWRPFVINPWNYLDTTVVVVGLFSIFQIDLGPLSNLKMLRAFRIARLLKRIKSLNKIIVALVRSIPGVMNAFVVMFIFMAIYAVLAVDLFRDFGADGTYETIQRYGPADATWGTGAALATDMTTPTLRVEERVEVSAMTARGFHYGQEYFGTFSRSLYTLFQVLTGESWSEAVARPLLFGHPPENAVIAAVFFTSFILLTAIILQNVVVTVLLDNFLANPGAEADGADATAQLAANLAGIDLDDDAPAPAPATDAPTAVPTAASADGGVLDPQGKYPNGAAVMAREDFDALRKQADHTLEDLATSLRQMDEIMQLLPPAL